jgi:hypothetical protein
MKAHGITLSVTDTPNCSPPLCHTAEIISPLTNRYIQLIEKTDYLLRALDPLFQKEVISMEEYNLRRGLFKRHVKRFYYACRRFDEGLRGRMDAYEAATANGSIKIKGNGAAHATSSGATQATSATRRGVTKSRKPKAMPPADTLDDVSGGPQAASAREVGAGETAQDALAAPRDLRSSR